MKAVAALLLLFSLPGARFTAPPRTPAAPKIAQEPAPPPKGGKWYFAENGHAVYCYGPVVLLPEPRTGVRRIATFCQGNNVMVPLKD